MQVTVDCLIQVLVFPLHPNGMSLMHLAGSEVIQARWQLD